MREATEARIKFLLERLSRIEDTRKELIQQSVSLDVEFATTKRERDSLHNSIAPISSLPNEILAEIFTTGQDEFYDTFGILVSHVTHHWREVALDTSALWATIHRHIQQQKLDVIAVYLTRSKQIPIHIVIEIGSDNWSESDEELGTDQEKDGVSPFCRLVEPHLSRCCQLSIHSSNAAEDSEVLLWLSIMSMPILRSLYLALYMACGRQSLQILEGGAQSLTHVHIAGLDLIHCNPPLDRVTTLELDLLDWPNRTAEYQRLSDVLSAIPNLIHLKFMNTPRWPSNVKLSLFALRTMSCDMDDLRELPCIFGALTAPSLVDMTMGISLLHCDCDEGMTLTNFPSLQTLHLIVFEGIDTLSILTLCRAFPFLVEITIISMSNEVDLDLRKLISSMGTNEVLLGTEAWPLLQTIAVSPIVDEMFPVIGFREFLIKRASVNHPIRTLLLPKALIPEATQLSTCTQPPVIIAEYLDNCYETRSLW